MEAERWKQIDRILAAALERQEGKRAAYLDEACGGDEGLRRKVESLLAAHQETEDFLEEPAIEMVAEKLARDEADTLVGRQLGSYLILSFIAAGGMGEVYRARDTQLDREVAIKVLPAEFTQDPERLARFQREAKLLAALNHPNIAAIYGLEESDGVRFLVLELVEGETLGERLVKGALPVEEALEVCRQIAEGVEAAHEKGVIHRDLKPANVKVTPEGKVKILDFGLAKAFEGETSVTDLSQSPTLTRAGVILGTAAYMSPEQAKGKPVDKRADIFAFGAVLYELLTGKRAFEGETIAETIAAVLKSEPEWGKLPGNTPWRIKELLDDSLQKEANDRLHDIADVRIQIKKALKEPVTASPTDVAGATQPGQQRWALTVGLVVLGAVVAGLAVWLLIQPSSPEQSLNRLLIRPSPPAVLACCNANEVAISPDGRQLVYMAVGEGGRQLYLRSLGDFLDRPIPGTANPSGMVFFSPDGKSIVFFTVDKLKKTSLAGGSPITLCNAPFGYRTGDWFEDTIVFSAALESGQGLYRVSANGGEPERLATVNPDEGGLSYGLPDFLPDGKDLLFTIRSNTGYQTALLSLETGERKVVLENARQARYLSTGHLIYEQGGTGNLMAVPFDLAALEVTGDSVQVVQGVRQTDSIVDYAISRNGTLVYVPAKFAGSPRELVWVDREGSVTPLTETPRAFESPRLSPDGGRIAVTIRTNNPDVWVYDLSRGNLTRLTFDEEEDETPIWTPDGERVTFSAVRDGGWNLFWKPADGSASEELLSEQEYHSHLGSWSPNEVLAFQEQHPTNGWDIWVLPLEGDSKPQSFLQTAFNEDWAKFSPDGQWLAYMSNESGRNEIYVQPYPGPGGKWQISTEGGTEPVWSPKGNELFYRNGDQMMVVAINTQVTFSATTPRVLFEGQYDPGLSLRPNYDVTPDGQRFVMVRAAQGSEQAQINLVQNWFSELKRLVPTGE
jgi:serine/threonine protein kinase